MAIVIDNTVMLAMYPALVLAAYVITSTQFVQTKPLLQNNSLQNNPTPVLNALTYLLRKEPSETGGDALLLQQRYMASCSCTPAGISSPAWQEQIAANCSSPDELGHCWVCAAAALDDHIGCIVACPNALLDALATY